MAKVSKLRIYTIREGKMDEWIAGWKSGVVPLRVKHGFRVDGAWVVRAKNTFVWILTYDGPGDWETKDADYYASEDRMSMSPDPARLIAHAEEWTLAPVSST